MNAKTDAEVAAYLDRLRRELADLPDEEIEEILTDLEPQLAAIAAGLDDEPGTLADRLGDPAEYASELRDAMGVSGTNPGTSPTKPTLVPRAALWLLLATTATAAVAAHLSAMVHSDAPRPALWLLAFGLLGCWLLIGVRRATLGEIGALPEVLAVRHRLAAAEAQLPVAAHLARLRPGLRLVKAAFAWVGGVWLLGWFGWRGASAATAAVAFAVLAARVGNLAQTDRRWLWLGVPLTGWAAGAAVRSMEILPWLTTGEQAWP